ncbi:hypothetical protein ABT56_14690 [Photobacterium aquae]|uniref:Lipoprotein n=1 Tax=Photobacterium aquae TaxID=1195763 RepID=A0A0J1JQ76_9GAMM|nr:hypothetical protein [Photobacterium aquae]KLV04387.1 hypothetical protein ABT56_14690 [Photobacterium aquae]
MDKSKRAAALLSMVLLAGCGPDDPGKEAQGQQGDVAKPVESVQPTTLPAELDLWQSPSEITLADTVIHLGSALWLNSMPVIGDDGSTPANKLFASVRLLPAEKQAFPDGVDILQVLIAQDDEQWLAKQDLDVRRDGERGIEVALRGGPEWIPGSKADIALTLLYKGKEYVLVEKGIVIEQVY